MEGSQNIKSRSRDPGDAHYYQFYIFCLVPRRIVLHAKCGVSSFTRSEHMEGSQNIKIGHVTQATPFLGIVHIFLKYSLRCVMWAPIRDSCSTDVSAEAQYVSHWKYITTGQNWVFGENRG